MIDPTAPTNLGPPIGWTDAGTEAAFAARAARYLRDQGLSSEAIVVALRTELGLEASEAIRLAGGQLAPSHSSTGCRHDPATDSPWRGSRPFTPITSIVEPIAH